MATAYFIRHGRFSETLKIAKLLLADEQDLIHKAVGGCYEKSGSATFKARQRF
jgi:3-methyladenine DNA glycosylase AlkD